MKWCITALAICLVLVLAGFVHGVTHATRATLRGNRMEVRFAIDHVGVPGGVILVELDPSVKDVPTYGYELALLGLNELDFDCNPDEKSTTFCVKRAGRAVLDPNAKVRGYSFRPGVLTSSRPNQVPAFSWEQKKKWRDKNVRLAPLPEQLVAEIKAGQVYVLAVTVIESSDMIVSAQLLPIQ